MINTTIKVFALVLAAGASAAAQNSYSNMLSSIHDMNQSWFTQQNAYNKSVSDAARAVTGSSQPAPADPNAVAAPAAPAMPQYPITATDFAPLRGRIMPDRLAKSATGVNFLQRAAIRASYLQFLSDFEIRNRRNNLAAAMVYIFGRSVRAVYGHELTQAEVNLLGANFNDALAANPQFLALPPQQKQELYESLVITGATVSLLQTQGMQQNDSAKLGQAKELGQMFLKQWLGI